MPPRDEGLRSRLQGLKAEPPCWGSRRPGASWHVAEGWAVKKTRVLRVMREHHLLVKPNPTLNATRTPSRSTPRPTKPDEGRGIEMTKGMVEGVSTLGIQHAFTSENHPKGTADPERVMRTLNEEGRWRQEGTSPFALSQALEVWIADDHEHYLHSALGDKSSRQFERHSYLSHGTPFVAA